MTGPDHKAQNLSQIEQETIRSLNRQAISAFLNHLPGVEDLCQQILDLAAPDGLEHPRDLPGAAEAVQTLGRFYMARTEYGKALDYFQQSLQLCEQGNLERERPSARAYVGVVFTSLGDYSRAAELLRQAHREAEEIQDDRQVAEILNDLSYTYVLAGEPELALTHLQASIQIFRDLHDDMRLSWALDSLGQAYLQIGQKDTALACVLESLNLAVQHGMWIDVVRFTQSAGVIYRAVGEFDNAMRMFQETLNLSRKYAMPENECGALFLIAEQYQSAGNFAITLPLLEQAEHIANQTGIKPYQRQCNLLLSKVYKNLGDFEHALEYHEKFYQIDKEIFNADTDQRLRNVQALYQLETAKKETDLYQLRAQALQLEIEDRRRTEAILKHWANTDQLTDLLNRHAFFDLAEKAFTDARNNNSPLSIILIDIDHFKQVNDDHGHLVGDQTLALVANRLNNHLRGKDTLARYGGEEFIVLLEGVSPTYAQVTAERLRQSVANEPFRTRGTLVPVTLSMKMASLPVCR